MNVPISQLERLTELHGIAFFIKDAGGRYTYINRSGAEMMKRVPSEIIGRDDFELFTKASAEFIINRDRSIMQSAHPSVYDAIAETPEGWRRYYSGKLRIPHVSGFGLLGLSADVTKTRDGAVAEVIRHVMEQLSRGSQTPASATL